MPQRTKDTIIRKWNRKFEILKKKAEIRFDLMAVKCQKRYKDMGDRASEKYEKKKKAYINKKGLEYKRKMMNEIREYEGRPKKEYKHKVKKLNELEFAMQIAQENAKLRDSDADGNAYCISCDKWCSWKEGHGGHLYTRKFQNMCLELENINFQCRTCNYITGPMGNIERKVKTNNRYKENLVLKYGEGVLEKLKAKSYKWTQGKEHCYEDLRKRIPALIDENDRLRATKNFRIDKKWRQKREKREKYRYRFEGMPDDVIYA